MEKQRDLRLAQEAERDEKRTIATQVKAKVRAAAAPRRRAGRRLGRAARRPLTRPPPPPRPIPAQVDAWRQGKKNMRAILSTLHEIVPAGIPWEPVGLAKLLQASDVKKVAANTRTRHAVLPPQRTCARPAPHAL